MSSKPDELQLNHKTANITAKNLSFGSVVNSPQDSEEIKRIKGKLTEEELEILEKYFLNKELKKQQDLCLKEHNNYSKNNEIAYNLDKSDREQIGDYFFNPESEIDPKDVLLHDIKDAYKTIFRINLEEAKIKILDQPVSCQKELNKEYLADSTSFILTILRKEGIFKS